MTATNKILLPVALVALLVGGSVGALISHSHNSQPAAAQVASTETTQPVNTTAPASSAPEQAAPATTNQSNPAATSPDQQAAYKNGFNDGYNSRQDAKSATTDRATTERTSTTRHASYRTRSGRTVASAPQRAYYDYNNQTAHRSFWNKHRDKLTVGMGTGAGALIGGLIGGGKGAAIGALAGGGGSALYTYKIRKNRRNY